MIQEVTEGVTFYQELARVVEQARLKDPRLKVQREIIRRADAHLIKLRKTERDPFKKAVWNMLDFLAPPTLSNVLRGIDTPSYFTLCRIGWGLGLDEKTIEDLAVLLAEEEPRNHSTTHRRIAIVETMKGGTKQPGTENDVPSWAYRR